MSKRFPIQAESRRGEDGKVVEIPKLMIPWSVAEVASLEYSRRYGTRQSLARLAQRGGFGREELLDLLGAAAANVTAGPGARLN